MDDDSSSDHASNKSTVANNSAPSSLMKSSSSSSSNRKRTKGTTPETAIPVENYSKNKALINLDYYCYESTASGDVREISHSSMPKKPDTFTCEICAEEKAGKESFRITGCKHTYCLQCVVSYVSSKLGDNVVKVGCPVVGCLGFLHPTRCRNMLPPQLMERWGLALCESSILESQKFYCPFKDCSALLLMDDHDATTAPPGTTKAPPVSSVQITQSECPYCRRLFCAHCKAPWHQGIDCVEFQKLGKGEREREDIMLMQLAKNKKWARCNKCTFYVEKIDGCMFILCRCGNSFCYNCGATPMISHFCSSCKR